MRVKVLRNGVKQYTNWVFGWRLMDMEKTCQLFESLRDVIGASWQIWSIRSHGQSND